MKKSSFYLQHQHSYFPAEKTMKKAAYLKDPMQPYITEKPGTGLK
jgi:hypothetical protein